MTSLGKFIRPLAWALAALAPASAFSHEIKGDHSDPSKWTYSLDPAFGLKTALFFTPAFTGNDLANGSNVQPVAGPVGSLRLMVYNGNGTLFSSVDTQAALLLNTPQTAGLFFGAGFSAGYRMVKQEIRIWGGLSYEGFSNISGVAGGALRLGVSKKLHDDLEIELEGSYFYAKQNIPTGTVNYELTGIDALFAFPFNL
ncbi:MAG: hypothetical protein P4M08_01000 [Oligoflexia bacterium]|nr:hypothetical protein [Oligoflexia bacterium]